MPSRRYLYILTRDNATASPWVDLQLRDNELRAIGHVTTQWAFLELAILRESRGLARHLGIVPPDDVNAVAFNKRRDAWESLARSALAELPEELARSLAAIKRTAELATGRHRITHNIIEYDTKDRNRLKAFPRANLGKFGWPLDAAKIEKTAQDIARLSYAVLTIHAPLVTVPGASSRKRD